jgi:DNA-binding transcriptional regulator YiaG
MPNIATAMRNEITRIARKEIRGETQAHKKSTNRLRADVAAMKRRVTELEKLASRLVRSTPKLAVQAAGDTPDGNFRYSTRSLIALRRRLGLTGQEFAALLGVSAQSVYKWESGKARPRASQITAIVALRRTSKKEASARLQQVTIRN